MPICVHSCVATAARTIPQRRNSVHKCPERPFLPICVHSCVAAQGEASRGGFDGVLARKARSGPGNARTGGETETPSGCRTTCSPRRGIVLVRDSSSTHPVGSPCEAFPPREAERLASRLEVRHTPRHVSRQLTEQGHPARAISPKPARARICRQRRSRSPPETIIQPIVPGTSPGPLM